jgi:hypothetical protein
MRESRGGSAALTENPMTLNKFAFLLAVALSPCRADVMFQLNIDAEVTTGLSPISNIGIIYAGSDGITAFTSIMQASPTNSCAASSSCTISGSSEKLLPDNWLPSLYSVYTLIGFYDGGPDPGDVTGPLFNWTVNSNPKVFVLADNGVNLTGEVFEDAFDGATELQVATDVYNAYFAGHRDNVQNLVLQNTSSFPSAAFSSVNTTFGTAIGSSGTLYNFTNGAQNGSAEILISLQNTAAAVPEPSTWMLLGGALALLVLKRR